MKKASMFVTVLAALISLLGSFFVVLPKVEAANSKAYDYSIVYQSPYPSPLKPGEATNVWIEIKNTGYKTWVNNGFGALHLASGSIFGGGDQKDHPSQFANDDWLSQDRAATIKYDEVAHDYNTFFEFKIKAPTAPGTYRAYFTPVAEYAEWMNDIGIYWQISVTDSPAKNPNNDNSVITLDANPDNKMGSPATILNGFAPSVVKLICKNNSNTNNYNQGSGVVFKNTTPDLSQQNYYILTNLHVIKTEDGSSPSCLIQEFPNYKNTNDFILFKTNGFKTPKDGLDLALVEPKELSAIDKELEYGKLIGIQISKDAGPYFGKIQDLNKIAIEDSEIFNNAVQQGDELFALGYPSFGGNNITVTKGEALGFISYGQDDYIETNAKFGPGFSGGITVNTKGDIIGIPTMILKKGINDTDPKGLVLYYNALKNIKFQ